MVNVLRVMAFVSGRFNLLEKVKIFSVQDIGRDMTSDGLKRQPYDARGQIPDP